MESKETGDSGAVLRKSGRIRSRILRLSPGANDGMDSAGNPNPDPEVLTPRKRKTSDSELTTPQPPEKENKRNKTIGDTVTEIVGEIEQAQDLTLSLLAEEPKSVKIKKEPESPPAPEAEPKLKKKRGRKSKASQLEESTTPAAPEPDSLELKLEKLEKSVKVRSPAKPPAVEPEKPKEPVPAAAPPPAAVVPEEEEELEWSDAPGQALSVIWGEQITNSIKRLTNLKFFCLTTSAPTSGKPESGSGEEGVEELPKAPAKRRASAKRSVGGGGGGKKGRGKTPVRGTPLGVYFTNNGTFDTGIRNFKVDTLFGGEIMLGAMEGMELVVQPPEGESGSDQQRASVHEVPAEGSEYYEMVEVGDGVMVDNVASYENVLSTEGDGARILTFSAYKKKKRSSAAGGEGTMSTIITSDPVIGKPNNTYTEIIGKALEENPTGLTVSEIYDWISTKYPYYHPNDDRWKNSVRHNLSISPYFYKGEKSTAGAGHIWTLAESCKDARPSNRKKSYGGVGTRSSARHDPVDLSTLKTDTEMAVASILGKYRQEVSVPEPELGYEEVLIPNEVAIGIGNGTMNSEDALSLDPLDRQGREVVEVTIHNMALQPGYTINLEELFANQMGYSMNLAPGSGSGEGSLDSDKENHTSGMIQVESDYASMALDQIPGVPSGPRAEPVLDYGASLGREAEHLDREMELRTLSDIGSGRDISVAELGFHSPIGSGDEDPLGISDAATQPFETKDDYAMTNLFDETGLPIMFN